MGIVVFLICAAAFAVAAVIALILGHFAFKGHPDPDERTRQQRQHAYLGGLIGSPVVAAFVIFNIPAVRVLVEKIALGSTSPTNMEALVDLLANALLSLLIPIVLGAVLLTSAKRERGSRAAIIGWASAGALHGTLISPFLAWATYEASHTLRFNSLCSAAEVRLLERIAPAKSLTVVESPTVHGPELLMVNTALSFVEQRGSRGDYVRLSRTADGSVVPGTQRSWTEAPAGELRGEYVVLIRAPDIAVRSPFRGVRLEMKRRSDDRLIAFAQYFAEGAATCPEGVEKPIFFLDFIKDALNIRDPIELDRMAQEKSCTAECFKYGRSPKLTTRSPWTRKGQSADGGPWTCSC